MEITIPLLDKPGWIEGLVFRRVGDNVSIEVRKTSGSDYGHALIDKKTFADIMLVLGLTP
jgi:hypothetical protein